MKILVLNSRDRGGGAEQVAVDLVRSYRRLGHDARLLVGLRRDGADAEAAISRGSWGGLWHSLEHRIRQRPSFRGQYRLVSALRAAALPRRAVAWWRGDDLYHNPASADLVHAHDGAQPDIIHAHNLHGDYFDLRVLPQLSARIPLVWTMHDAWPLSGHCAYPVDCRRWLTGCGSCPDLARAPAIRHDGSARNWQARRRIAARSRVRLALPSRWLHSLVRQSFWQQHEARVIPNGVDLTIFRPGDRAAARAALNLPDNAFVVVFNAAHAAGYNPYKDVATIQSTLLHLQRRAPNVPWLLLAVGHQPPLTGIQQLRMTGYLSDRQELARVYQAADVLLHAAHAENHPLVVLEALACGLPVVATAVGGIGEQVEHGVSGLLAPRAAAGLLARYLIELALQPARRAALGQAALQRAQQLFDLEHQAQQYLAWFAELQAGADSVGVS